MKRTSKRVGSGLLAIATAAAIVPLLGAPAASAAGVPQAGGASVRTPGGGAALNSGNSGTSFTLRLPTGASCAGDSANDGYRVQSYMVPASVDPSTLTFDSLGPTPNTLGANFRQPLYDTNGSSYVNVQTAAATPPPGPGLILPPPDFNFGAVFTPGDIPPGAYNIGIACTLGAPGPTQMKEFWNTTMTFTTNGGDGFANVDWGVGATPAAPSLTTVAPAAAGSALTATFTAPAATPAVTGYTVTATPTGAGTPGATTVTQTGSASPITVAGLVNGAEYSVTVTATNSLGTSPASTAVLATPTRPAVQNLAAVAGAGTVSLDWDAPLGEAPTGYTVVVTSGAGTVSVNNANTSATVTGLNPGVVETFTVTPTYSSAPAGTPASISVAASSASVVNQQIEVTRPVGALVLTQRCGVYGPLGAEPASPGFAAFAAQPASADQTGTAPSTAWDDTTGGSAPDGAFAEYPYPVDEDGADDDLATEGDNGTANPSYPTHCGVKLGSAKLVTGSGPERGNFFATSGRLNQITVVDTRDSDPAGWTVNGSVEDFATTGASFDGDHLGWTPFVTDDSDPFDPDLDGPLGSYDQAVTAGTSVAPRTLPGLEDGKAFAFAAEGSDLGVAVLDGRLKLLIPVTARNGRYVATLSFTVI